MALRFSWVLANQLAVGSAPAETADLDQLAAAGVRAVFSLCPAAEVGTMGGMAQRFDCRRLALPDSTSGRHPQPAELERAVALLAELLGEGPVYLHCRAGMERSPLVAMGWLMCSRGLRLQAALEYLREVHPGSAPSPEQLAVLRLCRWQNQVPSSRCCA